MYKEFEIDSKTIGPDTPTYIVAEIGINHNGDEGVAFQLIDAAVDAGADAVKFQKRDLSSIYTEDVLEHPEKFEQSFQYMIPLLKTVELAEESYVKIKRYCDEKNITFICTPFDPCSAGFLNDLGVSAYKIASADLTNSELLALVGSYRKPMIISTGMSSWEEIDTAVETVKGVDVPFALLHCRSVYPVWPREVNLRAINILKKYGVPVGYSGHEIGITIALVAASMGASIIEKHITLNKRQKGPDHKVSLEPYELKRLVRDIRIADQAIGRKKRYMLRGEVLNRELFGKSLVAAQTIAAGQVITDSFIKVKGPGKGLAPDRKKELIGKTAHRKIFAHSFFTEEDITGIRRSDFTKAFRGEWGLITRFTDYQDFLQYKPKVLEFHLAEKDFDIAFSPTENLGCALVVHAPEYLGDHLFDLCSASEDIRLESLALVDKTLELTKSISRFFIGKPKVIVHPGAMSLRDKLDKKRLGDTLEKSYFQIKEKLAGEEIELLLENLPPYPWYFGGQWKGNYFMSSSEIVDFCQRTDCRICFDLSHGALYCNAKGERIEQMVETLLPYSRHLHLADGYGLDGEGVQFGEGDIDLKTVMPLFKDYTYSWVPEVWRGHLDDGRGFIDALEYLKTYDL